MLPEVQQVSGVKRLRSKEAPDMAMLSGDLYFTNNTQVKPMRISYISNWNIMRYALRFINAALWLLTVIAAFQPGRSRGAHSRSNRRRQSSFPAIAVRYGSHPNKLSYSADYENTSCIFAVFLYINDNHKVIAISASLHEISGLIV